MSRRGRSIFLIQIAAGTFAGVIVAWVCIWAGLQGNSTRLLYAVCVGTGILGSVAGSEACKLLNSNGISREELIQIAGRIAERHSTSVSREEVDVALRELLIEVKEKS